MAWLRRIAKTFLALLAGVGLVVGAVLLWRRRGRSRNEALQQAVTETKDAIEEARQVAAVEVSAARNRELELKRRLKGVTKMPDKRRRREELLKLYREVR